MSHQTEIIDSRKLSDSEFAILIRCCDPCPDCEGKEEINLQCKKCHLHWHTMHSSVVNDAEKLNKSLEFAHDLAAQNHAAAQAARERLETLKGSKVTHDGN